MKKIKFCCLLIVLLASFFVSPIATYATPVPHTSEEESNTETEPKDNPPVTTGKELFRGGACHYILGMVNWDCDVVITNNQEDLKTKTWVIAANIASDITILASFLALGYVIYGGYLYIFSGGEPSKAASGKKTLTQAFIGLAVTMTSTIIMSTIRSVLLSNSEQDLLDCATRGCVEPDRLFINTLHWFIAVAGIVSTIFIVYGGITYTSSAGDPNKLSQAKKVIINALIGLAIVALAEIIVAFVSKIIIDSKAINEDDSASYLDIRNEITAGNNNTCELVGSLPPTDRTRYINNHIRRKERHA